MSLLKSNMSSGFLTRSTFLMKRCSNKQMTMRNQGKLTIKVTSRRQRCQVQWLIAFLGGFGHLHHWQPERHSSAKIIRKSVIMTRLPSCRATLGTASMPKKERHAPTLCKQDFLVTAPWHVQTSLTLWSQGPSCSEEKKQLMHQPQDQCGPKNGHSA